MAQIQNISISISSFLVLTLFIMSELIINSKLATAGPGHFELQKYPLKRKLYEEIAV